MEATARNTELGLIEAPGVPGRWLWAFTCPTPDCGCRTALLLSSPSGRETLLECGQVVADAWRGGADYPATAGELKGVTAFAVDLDTREAFPPVGATPIDPRVDPAVKAVVDGLDDDALDAIARVWHLGKGKQPPLEPGAGGGNIEVEGWRPGDLVIWGQTQPALRSDIYVLGEHVYDAIELYCVEPDCSCGIAIVDFEPVAPRGASHPDDIKFDGTSATLRPEGRHSRLPELWAAYQERHPHHQERFAQRSSLMHGFAGRIVAEPPKPKVKIGRNERSPRRRMVEQVPRLDRPRAALADRVRRPPAHCLPAHVNCKPTKTGVSFTWEGAWEFDPMSGSGRVTLGKNGRLKRVLRIKGSDGSTFVAEPSVEPKEPIPYPPSYRDKWRRW